MKVTELRELATEELTSKLNDCKQELFNLRFQHATGQLENPVKMREMTEVELNTELGKMKKELFNLRFQHVTGQLENPVKMRELKRDIARVKTIFREKELAK